MQISGHRDHAEPGRQALGRANRQPDENKLEVFARSCPSLFPDRAAPTANGGLHALSAVRLGVRRGRAYAAGSVRGPCCAVGVEQHRPPKWASRPEGSTSSSISSSGCRAFGADATTSTASRRRARRRRRCSGECSACSVASGRDSLRSLYIQYRRLLIEICLLRERALAQLARLAIRYQVGPELMPFVGHR
jgi:hypothetical protein